ncbi:MAG: 2-amino-4-hydroxy-6-hydroxymethyldihydropteridine diphosphokinase, partial [Muribaculaceae bacterium]|nr:2-amino-4-hydroxy-6-hydroxymethyldihydropteridine diphosphokinase [Muribaculaceae bacterium]
MSKIHINIGSNIGDRAALIERAVAAHSESLDTDNRCAIRLAPLIESAPWGYESTNSFLNLGLRIETPGEETPESSLKTLQT